MHFEPADYPGIFEIGDGRITYLRTGRGGATKKLQFGGRRFELLVLRTKDI
jgi:hypothetical protein